jgi:uncharacterized protein YegJ (DUF2314 family)
VIRARWIVLAGAFVLTTGATQVPPSGVVSVPADDARMNAAIAKARSTVRTFEAALRSPKPSQYGFSVKVRIDGGGNAEHFWTSGVTYDGTVFHARIANDPEVVTTVKLGQAVSVHPRDISDWMYVDDGVLVGGYTLRALRDALSPADRAELDKRLPFKVLP